jgi:hypothetical protein
MVITTAEEPVIDCSTWPTLGKGSDTPECSYVLWDVPFMKLPVNDVEFDVVNCVRATPSTKSRFFVKDIGRREGSP